LQTKNADGALMMVLFVVIVVLFVFAILVDEDDKDLI